MSPCSSMLSWRCAALVLLAYATAGCSPRQTEVDPAITRFDGIYRGAATPDRTAVGCEATVHSIRIEVSAGQIWVQTHHRGRQLGGTVAADGQIVMQDAHGNHSVTGLIQDNRLTATETTQGSSRRSESPYADGEQACVTSIDASRVPNGAAGG